mmetsp:Transcript_43674/g.87419  ORF Transcript_43674/g.87419 Transcript_43674/m.87419 type:complete len:90 (-) Transcript_43674:195-464(-)
MDSHRCPPPPSDLQAHAPLSLQSTTTCTVNNPPVPGMPLMAAPSSSFHMAHHEHVAGLNLNHNPQLNPRYHEAPHHAHLKLLIGVGTSA